MPEYHSIYLSTPNRIIGGYSINWLWLCLRDSATSGVQKDSLASRLNCLIPSFQDQYDFYCIPLPVLYICTLSDPK